MNHDAKKSQGIADSASSVIEAVDFDSPLNAPSVDSRNYSDKDLIGTSHRPANKAPWWYSQFNLMLAVFGLLATAAIIFVLLAPPPSVNDESLRQTAQNSSSNVIADSEAPWNQSQRTQARGEAQTILSNLLTAKKELEIKGVLVWAPERYQQALDLAAQGDDLYKQQDFPAAIIAYKSSVEQMDALYELLPKLVTTRIAEGHAAIEQGKADLAKELFSEALKLDSGSLLASLGLDRAAKLDQVLELIRLAGIDETDFLESGNLEDLIAAEKKLQDAKIIDKYYQSIELGLARVTSLIVEKRFKMAMSDAYQALFTNRYTVARKSFAEALKIKPGDNTAAAALQQSLAADKTTSLNGFLANARRFEKQEEWASARSNYQTVLQRDPSQVSAKLGVIRAGARQKLDADIRKVLADPLAFNRTETNSRANQLLADARAIRTQGSTLQQQIVQLESALAQAGSSIKVSLISDGLTDVSLQKTGSKIIKLGVFGQKKLALKPGRYTAIGVRLGYRDVRTQIELWPGNDDVQSFTIICKEAVQLSASRANN